MLDEGIIHVPYRMEQDNVRIPCATLQYCIAQLRLTLCDPTHCSPPGSSVHRIFQARILKWVCHFLFQGIFPDLGPESPALQADSLLSEPPGEGCTQNSTQFKTYNLFVSGIFHLIFSHYASLQETKTAEKKTAGKGWGGRWVANKQTIFAAMSIYFTDWKLGSLLYLHVSWRSLEFTEGMFSIFM